MEAVVLQKNEVLLLLLLLLLLLHRVGFLENFCPKHGQDFKPSAAPQYPNMGKVPPLPRENIVFFFCGRAEILCSKEECFFRVEQGCSTVV